MIVTENKTRARRITGFLIQGFTIVIFFIVSQKIHIYVGDVSESWSNFWRFFSLVSAVALVYFYPMMRIGSYFIDKEVQDEQD